MSSAIAGDPGSESTASSASPVALGYRARALVDGAVVADSTGAMQLEVSGNPPMLCFPRSDVRVEVVDADLLVPLPAEGLAADYVAFDDDRARVEVIDSTEADAKRWPTWGDATDLIRMLDVIPDGDGYVSAAPRGFHCRAGITERVPIEASHVLGQTVVIAGRHAPGRRVVHASLVCFRMADASLPLRFDVAEPAHGKTFTTLVIDVTQQGRRCMTVTLLLDTMAPDLIRHSAPAPAIGGPDDAEPYDMWVTGRDLRVADGAYTGDPDAPVGPPVIDAWLRFHELPDDPAMHAGLLAQFIGHLPIAAALRPHPGIGEYEAHRTVSTAIMALSLSIHADVRADEWMLYHHESTFAGDGMTHAACRVHDEQGRLLASFSVEAMVRGFPEGATVDERSSM